MELLLLKFKYINWYSLINLCFLLVTMDVDSGWRSISREWQGGLIMCLLIFRLGECFPLFFDVDEWRKFVEIYITLVAGSTCWCDRHTFFDTNHWNSSTKFCSNCRKFEVLKVADFVCMLERCNLFLWTLEAGLTHALEKLANHRP